MAESIANDDFAHELFVAVEEEQCAYDFMRRAVPALAAGAVDTASLTAASRSAIDAYTRAYSRRRDLQQRQHARRDAVVTVIR